MPTSPVRLITYEERVPAVAIHGSLALALDSGPPVPAARPVLGVVRDGRPALRAEARLIAQLLCEVLAGVRPCHHLAGRTTPDLFERLHPLSGRLPCAAPSLASVRICEPRPEAAEVAAVARFGTRVQALALRLEHSRRWRCTAVETTVPG